MKFYEKILYLKIKYLCIEIQWTKNLNSQIITENTNISLILIISKLIELKIIFTNIVSNSNKISIGILLELRLYILLWITYYTFL